MSLINESEPSRWRRPASAVRRIMSQVVGRGDAPAYTYEFAQWSMRGYHGGDMAPDLPRAPDALRTVVDRLGQRHALDEGTGQVFDHTINAWVEQWANRVDRTHDARLSVLDWRAAEAEADVIRRRYEAELAEARLSEAEEALASLLGDTRPVRPKSTAEQNRRRSDRPRRASE